MYSDFNIKTVRNGSKNVVTNEIFQGIELNINPVLNESNIGGHDYLRNLVHLPFFLQNAALRKVKHVKMLESSIKRSSRLLDDDAGPGFMVRNSNCVDKLWSKL